jgi:hypothetical protein
MFGFVTTFANDFKFVIRSGVDLQQDHQSVRVQRNTIVPSLRGFNFKTSVHFSRFEFFITKMLR